MSPVAPSALRDDLPPDLTPEVVAALPDYAGARDRAGKLSLGRKDPRFWPAVGVALDVLAATAIWWQILLDPENRSLQRALARTGA